MREARTNGYPVDSSHIQSTLDSIAGSRETQEKAHPVFSAVDAFSGIIEQINESKNVQGHSELGKLLGLTMSMQNADLKKEELDIPSFSLISEIPSESCTNLIHSLK